MCNESGQMKNESSSSVNLVWIMRGISVKLKIKLTIFALFGIILTLSQLTACSTVNTPVSTPASSPSSTFVEQNEVAQMQKKIPFTIILPEYLPEEFKVLHPQLVSHIDNKNQVILDIYYYSLTSPSQISILEYMPSESLSPDILKKVHPESTILDMNGIQVLEKQMLDEVIRNTQTIRGYTFSYIWMLHDVYFLGSVFELDQAESRKIIQSMID
jgi:hypothetical protein